MATLEISVEDRNQMVNKTANLLAAKNQRIEDLQVALRACLTVLYEADVPCEQQRIAAIEQAHQVL